MEADRRGGSGVNPAKDNIFDAWSAVNQPGARTFLYLGFTREKANGTTTIAFELNQDARTWDNDKNPATPPIPCRRTGDVLIVYDAHDNDINVEVELERWVTETTDPSTGCATKGHLDLLPAPEPPETAADFGQGAVNAVPITSRLPGHFPIGAPIPDKRLFGEAALNLTALFKAAKLDSCFSYGSIWMHSRSSRPVTSAMQDYLAPKPLALNTCAAAGTKFLDLDANGKRDIGEPGLPGFEIWADYNNDGVLDEEKEPFTVSDGQGRYVLKNIRPAGGFYRLRETLLVPGPTAWKCSFPNAGTDGGFANRPGGLFGCGWGPIAAATTPFAQDKDFGNWLPAQLTVEKQLWPADDPGRFDLKVNGKTVLPDAGDGATVTGQVEPGSYDITEEAAQGTDPGAYTSSVTCQRTTTRRGSLRAGTGYEGLVLRAGDHATCTFTNVRNAPPPTPAIAIEKAGPTVATAGDTLHYKLSVTNPGDVPFPADSVHVSDPACDEPPALDSKGEDGSPGTLDPGDTWTYQCSNKTKAPDAACELSTVTNTATASVSANGTNARLHQARQVKDDDSLITTLNCPDLPPQPPVPDPGPAPPTPFPPPNPTPGPLPPYVPLVPKPPPAGQVGFARVSVPARCITSVSRVKLLGTHISDILVSVDGSRVRRQTLQVLQRSVRPLVVPLAPGRHRMTVRVVFERGSDSPPITLSTAFNICLAQFIPPVTG